MSSSGRTRVPPAASLLLLLLTTTISTLAVVECIELSGQSIKDALAEYPLLDVMNNNQFQGIEFALAEDGFPAYRFLPTADVKSPYRMLLPEKLYEFAIMATFRPATRTGGYLFSVVNPLDTIVQLGLHLSPAIKNVWNATLIYTQSDNSPVSRRLVSYELPFEAKKWTSLAFEVYSDRVIFYYDCEKRETTPVKREPLELVFDSASTLYLAQAGSLLKGHFEGNLEKLVVYGNPDVTSVLCVPPPKVTNLDNEIFNDLSGSGMSDLKDFDEDIVDEDFWASATDIYDASGLPPPTPPPYSHERPYRGIKGEKGERGLKGPPGDSIRGPPGPPGPPGPKGDSGTFPPFVDFAANPEAKYTGKCTCSASDILEAIKDNELLRESVRGPPGLPGKEGKTGAPGLTGATGTPGERGAPGLKGDRGDRGEPGPRGPEGQQGQKGDQGIDGLPGAAGPPGPPGRPGLPENYDESLMGNSMGALRSATPGPKGAPGDKGDIGRPGERGQPGTKGERGAAGKNGDKGDRGHPGPHGPAGAKGEPGQPGVPGLAGAPGASGLKGDRGLPGEMGPVGPPGPPGQVVFSDATASGLANATTQCQCPAGPAGPQGPRGQQGYEGPPGLNGDPGPAGPIGLTGLPGTKGEKGEKGTRGLGGPKGDRGPEGPPGQAFFAGGYEGMAMNGTKGEKGEKGMRGRRGKPGTAGPIGPPGKPGPMGDVGHSGRPGLPGPKGDVGQKGVKGDAGGREGPKGDKGDRGQDGRDGLPGPPGLPAAAGEGVQYIPMPGPPGPPGPPGSPGMPGISIAGPKGDPGMDSRIPYYGGASYYGRPGGRSSLDEIKALRELQDLKDRPDVTNGPPGPPGPPGPAAAPASHNDDEELPYYSASSTMRIVPGAVTFPNIEEMTKKSAMNPPGTIAYITEEEAILVRVNKGWQYIALGTLVPIATPAPPTTIAPPVRVDIQSSNLLNNLPPPIDTPVFTSAPEYETWYPRMLRVAALNEPYLGDLQGIRGADFACYRQGRRAGLLGTFKAFLSSRVQNLDSIVRLADRELPVVNTRGDVLFNSWKGIFNGQGGFFSQAPRIYSFSGKNVLTDPLWPQKVVWHGALPNGERAIETYCDAWHSAARSKSGLASNLLGNKLLDQESYTCDSKLIVLCVEALSQDRRKKRDLAGSEIEFKTADDYARHLNEVLT